MLSLVVGDFNSSKMTTRVIVKPVNLAGSASPPSHPITRPVLSLPRSTGIKSTPSSASKTPTNPGLKPSSHKQSPTPSSRPKARNRLETFLQQFNLWAYVTEEVVVTPDVLARTRKLWEDLKSGKELESRESEAILRDLEPVSGLFTDSLMKLYKGLVGEKGEMEGNVEPQVERAKCRLLQAGTSLSLKHFTDLKACNPPVSAVESVGLALLALIYRLIPVPLPVISWKALVNAVSSPVPLLSVLRDASNWVDNGAIDTPLILIIKEKLAKVSEKNLKDFDKSGSGLCFFDYLTSLIGYFEALEDQRVRAANPPSFLSFANPDTDMPSRKKLLTSLYQRVFRPDNSQ
jgi:hypothetical protein